MAAWFAKIALKAAGMENVPDPSNCLANIKQRRLKLAVSLSVLRGYCGFSVFLSRQGLFVFPACEICSVQDATPDGTRLQLSCPYCEDNRRADIIRGRVLARWHVRSFRFPVFNIPEQVRK